MSMLDTFEQMKKEAAEQTEKVASEEQETQDVNSQKEVLAKYAEWADDVLADQYGKGQYTEDDVEKLASAKIEADAAEQENREKVAEYFEAGQIMYAGFKAASEADSQE